MNKSISENHSSSDLRGYSAVEAPGKLASLLEDFRGRLQSAYFTFENTNYVRLGSALLRIKSTINYDCSPERKSFDRYALKEAFGKALSELPVENFIKCRVEVLPKGDEKVSISVKF